MRCAFGSRSVRFVVAACWVGTALTVGACGDAGENAGGATLTVLERGADAAPVVHDVFAPRMRLEVRARGHVLETGSADRGIVEHPSVVVELGFEPVGSTRAVDAGRACTVSILSVDVRDGGADPAHVAALREDLRRQDPTVLRGVLSFADTSPVVAFALPVPAYASARVKELLRQVTQAILLAAIPYPDAPLGDGARWSATRDITLAEATWRQHVECTLALQDERATVAFAATLEAPPQLYALDGLPDGTRAEIVEARARVSGHTDGIGRSSLARGARLDAAFDLRLRVFHAGAASEIRAQNWIEVVLEAVEAR